MATTPVVPAPIATPKPVETVGTVVKEVGVWLTPAHVILIALLLVVGFCGLYQFESRRVDSAEAQTAQVTAVAKQATDDAATAVKANTKFQQQTDTQLAQLVADKAILQQANVQLASANKSLSNALVAQQTKDATLSPNDQTKRWEELVPAAKVSTNADLTGFTLDNTSGLATLQALETIPVQAQQIANLNTTVVNDAKVIAGDATALSAEKAAHVSDVATDGKTLIAAKDETAKVQSDFNTYKKKAHRNELRAFVAGVVVGVVGTRWIGF